MLGRKSTGSGPNPIARAFGVGRKSDRPSIGGVPSRRGNRKLRGSGLTASKDAATRPGSARPGRPVGSTQPSAPVGSGRPSDAGRSGLRNSRLGKALRRAATSPTGRLISRSPVGKSARAVTRAVDRSPVGSAVRGTRGTRNPVAAAKRAATRHRKVGGSPVGALGAALGAGALAATKGATAGATWPVRRVARKHFAKRAKARSDKQSAERRAATRKAPRSVGDKVTAQPGKMATRTTVIRPGAIRVDRPARPGRAIRPTRIPTPDRVPAHDVRLERTMGSIKADAGRLHANVAEFSPRGIMPVIREFEDLPDAIGHIQGAISTLRQKANGQMPLDKEIVTQLMHLEGLLGTAASMARKVPAAIHLAHGADIARLGPNARVNEAMWDRSQNGLV